MKKEDTKKTDSNEEISEQNIEAQNVDERDEKISELTNDLQRLRADFENYRKQSEMQKNQAMEIAKFATVTKFLPLLDNIDLAVKSYPKELEPLMGKINETLKSLNLAKINSEPETEFDPELHNAVMIEEGDGEKEVIAETFQAGYFYENKVVRPAMVKVKKI